MTLTSTGSWVLRVDLEGWDGRTAYAKYQTIQVVGENYQLVLGEYTGSAGNSLDIHNGQFFTTSDNDLDKKRNSNCAQVHRGAWWYDACLKSNLNGQYIQDIKSSLYQGIWWDDFGKRHLKTCSMKIREQ